MPEVDEIHRVLFKMSLQLFAGEEFPLEFFCAGVSDCEASDGAQGVRHAVSEGVHLFHVEHVGLDFLAALLLRLDDLVQDLLVVCAARVGGWAVLTKEGGGDDEGEGHAGFAGSRGAADSVRVGFRRGGEVKVDDAGNV